MTAIDHAAAHRAYQCTWGLRVPDVLAAPRTTASACQRPLEVLEAEASAVFGSSARIEEACAALRELRGEFADPALAARLPLIARLVSSRIAAANASIVAVLCDLAEVVPDPWPVLEPLLDSQEADVVAFALHTIARLTARNPAFVEQRVLDGFALRASRESGPFGDNSTFAIIADILESAGTDVGTLYANGTMAARRLAAGLLDRGGALPSEALAAKILGDDNAAWLRPYLAWTRATHLDLLALASENPAAAVESLQRAEEICGAKLLREIIGETGWSHLNFGLDVERYAGIAVGESFPLLLRPCEEALLDSVESKRRAFDRILVVAHGGQARSAAPAASDSIARFRAYNLAHAELLADFLDVRPLTTEKVRLTVSRMDRIVGDFQLLFASRTDECPTLASTYADLRASIERALAAEVPEAGGPLSAELTRLVDMFEDPHSISEVHTLHGLKRYLHQRGLKLGMGLAETGGSASRTVTLLLATPERVLQTSRAIEYVDFEADAADASAPYAVRIVIDAFARQLVHAQQALPKVKVFCYGNEVHYFVAYRNHPAFVRIDYSPPSRGGMIDLAYFGVSKYELDAHPDPSLPAVERFFRRLDFDIAIDKTHVHARYDKERAFDLADLCAKASSLFRLAPYLMDIDWVIGDLALSAAARDEVAAAWAEHFATWGVLPYPQLLTADRRGILAGIENDAAGDREIRWNGNERYHDRYSSATLAELREGVRASIEELGLRRVVRFDGDGPVAQLAFEDAVLRPVREAIARGEIAEGGLTLQPPERFLRRHGAECLAGVLRSGAETIARSARVADVVAMLARGLRFRTTGGVNGYEIQRAVLPLAGAVLTLHVLRDASGIFRLGLFAPGDSLYAWRENEDAPWLENWSVDAAALVAQLRRANYPTPWIEPPADDPEAVAAGVLSIFRDANPHAALPPLPGERVLSGVAASPGRAVGPALLGLEGRKPGDVEGAILVCPAMTPADGAFLASAAGVVTTGGGALSHAGLLALQHEKPALIVSGTWQRTGANVSSLAYRTIEYDEAWSDIGGYRVAHRQNFRAREEQLHDGDLVVLDADEGVLHVIGSEPDALALHDSLRQLASAAQHLAGAATDAEILTERGRRLRARHQLEKVLGRITDPVLASHAASELLLRDGGDALENERLLSILLSNPAAADAARARIRLLAGTLTRRLAAARDEAMRLVPDSPWAWEVLSLRLELLHLAAAVASIRRLAAATGFDLEPCDAGTVSLDAAVFDRLSALRADLMERAEASTEMGRLRHLLDELERIDAVLRTTAPERAEVARLRHGVAIHDRDVDRRIGTRRIIDANAGGIELRRAAGNKAANLAEIARLGEGALVPPWFVVTDRAFREALRAPLAHSAETVGDAIESVVTRSELTNAQKSSLIAAAWERAELPRALTDEVIDAYAVLGAYGEPPFVAVRSSSHEEDLETTTRAGDFDTFLFVRGEEALIAHLKRAWSGLWSERALHNRAVFGSAGDIGGGILVQKMVTSVSSGVLFTVNVAERRLREMVINAGLGLGEGVVSGLVAADRIVVSKEGDVQHGELHFRYLTAEKRERVVFNSRLGSGTARVETLYHQRLRPALEYVEICELVRAAARLEAAYGYPLDIEFGIEGTALHLLQARPLPTPFAVWRDTIERWPLMRTAGEDARTPGGRR